MRKRCILSGREIPDGKFSREHYLARALAPYSITSRPENIFPSIKIFNQVKAAYYPCQWYKFRYDLCYHAYQHWNIRDSDRRLLGAAVLNGMPEYDPCEFCIARKYQQYCITTKHKDWCL